MTWRGSLVDLGTASYQEAVAAGMGHLHKDAPMLRCSDCKRVSRVEDDFGKLCGMSQPDGCSCGGRFLASSPTQA